MSTRSNCVVAHVRAASKGTGISYNNCHPFKAGRLMFCHNGRIFEFSKVRRRFISCISDESFDNIKGTTDSEVIFALVLTHLANDGYGVSPFEQKTPFGHKRLTAALKKSLRQIETLLEEARHTDGYSTCNFSLTDGDTMVVTRYCDQAPEIPPPSLYFAFGDAMTLYKELTQETVDASQLAALPHILSSIELSKSVHSTDSSSVGSGGGDFDEKPLYLFNAESKPGRIMADVDPAKASFIVSSNPLTKTHTWHPMPRNSIMWCTRGSHPELRLLRRTKSLMQPPPVFD
jgi:predicted glutamine amidotransferase